MKITEINKVTDKKDFNNYEDFEIYPTAELQCLNCNNKVSLNFRNLEKHSTSDFTNLSEQDAKKIAEFIKAESIEIPNSFLDYYCPNCGKPIRILYNSWGGGRHCEHGYELKFMISETE
jgi:DNA-directed RNA polymerase subunit RPC12/RpoP